MWVISRLMLHELLCSIASVTFITRVGAYWIRNMRSCKGHQSEHDVSTTHRDTRFINHVRILGKLLDGVGWCDYDLSRSLATGQYIVNRNLISDVC